MSQDFKSQPKNPNRQAFFSFRKKIVSAIFLLAFGALVFGVQNVRAQLVTTDPGSTAATVVQTSKDIMKTVKDTWWNKMVKILTRAGSKAFNVTLRRALNKVAYDYATALGSGDWGQQPLFQARNWGDYFSDIGDEAAGEFIEGFANDFSEENAKLTKELNTQEVNAHNDRANCLKACEESAGSGALMGGDYSQLLAQCQSGCMSAYDATMGPIKEKEKSLGQNNRPIATCQPSSIDVKLKIALGLAQVNRPAAPNCSATEMINNWGKLADNYPDKLKSFSSPDYLAKTLPNIFNPVSNDLGIALTLRSDLLSKQAEKDANAKLQASIGQGYTDKRNIAGNLISIPNKSRMDTEASGQMYAENFGQYTGDAFIDAANIFINQAALTAWNKLMASLAEKAKKGNDKDKDDPCASNLNSEACLFCTKNPNDPSCRKTTKVAGCNPLTDPSCAPVSYAEGNVQEAASVLIKPSFTTQADYDILPSLSTCVDPNNPGPTECVIDERFLQAVTEKKTVAEAIKDNFLNKTWLLSGNSKDYNSYNIRNISILRKYRILPVGWEEAANKIAKLNKKASLMDLVSCFNPNDEYNEFGSQFDVRDQAWCEGLVDPNWVLKAPLNYCRKQGSGGQIRDLQIVPGQSGQGAISDLPSSLIVSRADEYCADEQSCIKEKADGSCEAYGYCNTEKRTWSFGQDACEPIYNTCQTFTKANGSSVSYLKNTLDYGTCNADNAGCQAYSWFGSYNSSNGQVAWDIAKQIYLNDKAGVCSANEEGCTALYRVKPSWGSNLIMNANFDNDQIGDTSDDLAQCTTLGSHLNDWYFRSMSSSANNCNAEIFDASGLSVNGKALKLSAQSGDIGIYSGDNHSLLPDDFSFLSGQSYTFSADVYLVSSSGVSLWIGDDAAIPSNAASTSQKGSWQHLSFTRSALDNINDPEFAVRGEAESGSVEFYIKNLKFELSDFDTGYRLYGAYKVYEKVLPPYLEAACYVNAGSGVSDYTLKPNAPSICSTFARKCNKNEAGCELYSSLDNFAIPAQTVPADYCPGECLGYDTYVSKQSYFNSPAAENLIPRTARTCTAASVGCSEFTNLDETARGGENKEYYSFLKQCIKPDPNACGDFYVWQNGNESGYQLQALSLKIDTADQDPYTVEDDSAACSETVYNSLPGDPNYNPDCRQFYNKAGNVSYHLISKTVSCSDECKTFRMSEKNIDATIVNQAACNASNQSWDAVNNVCYSCLSGGQWDAGQQACLYKAIPSEGTKCSAQENGCREFNGNRGNNLRLIQTYDFENGISPWETDDATATSSPDSNNKDGSSIKIDPSGMGGIKTTLGYIINSQASYVIKFLAKAENTTKMRISLSNNDGGVSVFGPANPDSLELKGDNSWHSYQINLNVLNHEVSSEEYLLLEVDNIVKLDNVVLQEISDKYYLIARSSAIPDICYYDMLDKFQGADYNLGCSAYADRNGVQHNLHQFSRLCQDSAVGCEMMINTYNYSPYNSRLFNDLNDNKVCDSNEPDCVKVKQDGIVYAVFDKSKQCNSADQGCSLFGQAQKQGVTWYFNNVYKKNNPDSYDQSLCRSGDVGCAKWSDDNGGESYFKDPGLNACVYRNAASGSGKDWFRIPVKRCDLNDDGQIKNVSGANESAGSLCFSDTDCSDGHKCLVDNNDYSCSSSYLKTIGYGGVNNRIPTPDGSAGLCEATASGCTEYIDPVSKFSSNLVINPNFEDTNGDGKIGDGWTTYTYGSEIFYKQRISIQAGRLYKFYFSNPVNNFAINFKCDEDFRALGPDNQFSGPQKSSKVLANSPLLFLSPINNTCEIREGKADRSFELKEAIVSYQKQNEVDQKSCNGIVNFENGCVLFNERSQSGSKPSSLLGAWDAGASRDKNSPAACGTTTVSNVSQSCEDTCYPLADISFNTCNTNKLIKVRPDRTCGAWLDCSSYAIDPETKEKTCYAVSQCDRLDDKKECASFVKAAATSTSIHSFSFGSDKNSTGYSLLDKYYLPNMKEVGSDIGWHVDFESKATPLSCRKLNTSNTFGTCVFDKNINTDSIVSEPENAPTDYPAHGTGYLKVLSFYQISPMPGASCIPVVKGQDYYLNYLVNTKNSGIKAKIIIGKCSDNTPGGSLTSYLAEAPDGWERKVNKISIPSNFNSDGIRIFLTSDALDGSAPDYKENYVYFDDLNIEPVLKVGSGANDYIAKECRLYPSNDSLTCLSRGENVISDGLYGYCLEHDKNNKNVCLLWYPLDSISAGVNRNNKISGYKGTFPLNYCTEMNGNFNLLENRKTVFMGCFTHNTGDNWNRCYLNSPAGGTLHAITSGSTAAKEVGDFSWACNVGNTGSDASSIFYNQDSDIASLCGNNDYWIFKRQIGGKAATFCVPTFYNGWPSSTITTDYPYVGQENVVAEKPTSQEFSCNSGTDSFSMSEGWWPYNGMNNKGNVDESKNIENPIRVWDNIAKPRDPRDLKFAPLSNNDKESNYDLVCNKFTQLVDLNGYNMSWVDRLSKNSAYPTSTPDFFKYGANTYKNAPYNLIGYGRNRESIPFGAAILPANVDIFGLTAIKFRDQYSEKNQEDILAGRPYGCVGSGCSNIGSCSLNPNVFCLLAQEQDGKGYLASRSCYGGAYGKCEPIWQKPLQVSGVGTVQKDYENILKTLFIKSYAAYDLSGGTYNYGSYNFNHSQMAPSADRIPLCPSTTGRPADNSDSFCAVTPVIENAMISSNSNPVSVPSSGVVNIASAGVYRLDFNTTIDKEQQPLRDIYIDWDDGNIQVINNQDSRPSPASPHRIYHYYSTTGNKTLKLAVYDNWGIYINAFAQPIKVEEVSNSTLLNIVE
ncbi:MAG: hypothetical protein WC441_00400 [Patescibacteria group bacterium]